MCACKLYGLDGRPILCAHSLDAPARATLALTMAGLDICWLVGKWFHENEGRKIKFILFVEFNRIVYRYVFFRKYVDYINIHTSYSNIYSFYFSNIRMLYHHKLISLNLLYLLCSEYRIINKVLRSYCPVSLAPFYIVSYHIKLVKTF